MSARMTGSVDWEPLLEAALGHALAYRRSLPERRVAPSLGLRAMIERVANVALPAHGKPPADVLEELVELATPGLTSMAGPRFFGWVTGGTLPAALVADWMVSAWDQNAGPAHGAPAAAAFELAALGWLVSLLGLPEGTTGALVTGATLANVTCLAAARHRVLEAAGWDVEQRGLFEAPRVSVLVGHERHDAIDKALRLLGLGNAARAVLDADGQGRLVPKSVERALAERSGPVIVCAQAGNVNSGAFDALDEIAGAVEQYRARHGDGLAWLHVDGAFGLWARAAPAVAHLAHGAERADSWATDGHKFLNLPYDCGVALTRDGKALRRAMAVHGAYLSSGNTDAIATPGSSSPELSRRARGFVLWAALCSLGVSGVAALVTRACELARALARALEGQPGVRVQNEVVLNQVVVGFAPPATVSAKDFVSKLAVSLQDEGTCYATPTIWRGAPALRFSISNASTSADDVQRSARALLAVYEALRVAS